MCEIIIPEINYLIENSEDEIDFEVCNFVDASEAVTKYSNIREHLYSIS